LKYCKICDFIQLGDNLINAPQNENEVDHDEDLENNESSRTEDEEPQDFQKLIKKLLDNKNFQVLQSVR
jgi:flagellar biogenesis protein FliO